MNANVALFSSMFVAAVFVCVCLFTITLTTVQHFKQELKALQARLELLEEHLKFYTDHYPELEDWLPLACEESVHSK